MTHDDCLERSDLEARYREATATVDAEPATFIPIEGLPCLFVGAAEPELVLVLFHGYGAGAEELAPLGQLLCERLGAHRLQVVLPHNPAGAWFELDFTRYRADV